MKSGIASFLTLFTGKYITPFDTEFEFSCKVAPNWQAIAVIAVQKSAKNDSKHKQEDCRHCVPLLKKRECNIGMITALYITNALPLLYTPPQKALTI